MIVRASRSYAWETMLSLEKEYDPWRWRIVAALASIAWSAANVMYAELMGGLGWALAIIRREHHPIRPGSQRYLLAGANHPGVLGV